MRAAALACGTAFLAGCSLTESALPTAETEGTQTAVATPAVTGAPKVETIGGKGGTRIAVLVNDQAITNTDITRRAKFVKLRRMKGNANAVAKQELIDEAVKMQEARRLNAVVNDATVDRAYADFAKRNKMPVKVLGQILDRSGTTRRGFKQFIRAQMSWQRAVGARVRAGGGSAATPASVQGPKWLAPANSEASNEKEYTLQQVVFTVPRKKRGELLNRRTSEAKRFRGRINGCGNTRELAKGLKDVAVLDRGRLRASRLPPGWRKPVETTPIGKATLVRQTEKGAEMLIVCRSRDVRAAASAGNPFGGADVTKAAGAVEKQYLAELKKKAVIKER